MSRSLYASPSHVYTPSVPGIVRVSSAVRLTTGLLALPLVACGLSDVPGPPGAVQIVVQSVLSADASEQVIWIEQTIIAGAPIQGGVRPLDSPPERVEVRDSAGTVFAFQPDPANAARFVASFTPVHRGRYELLVEAGSWVVRGSTVVPAPITIVEPATDTARIVRGSELRVSWASQTSPWVVVFELRPDGQPVALAQSLTSGDTSYVFPNFFRDTTIAAVVAVDSVTARVVDPFAAGFGAEFEGNLTGGVGFFGASTGDRLVVIQQ